MHKQMMPAYEIADLFCPNFF